MDDLKIETLCTVLDKIPYGATFHLDGVMMESLILHSFPDFNSFSQFEYSNKNKLYDTDRLFILNINSISWLKEYIQSHNLLDVFMFYRIYDKDHKEILLRVYDTDSYEVSKSLNIEKKVIEEWNSKQGQGCYWGLSDYISYTKELIV